MTKIRNSECLIKDLIVGDRFYFASDKKKNMFETVEVYKGEVKIKSDDQTHPETYSGSKLFKTVVYLRNSVFK